MYKFIFFLALLFAPFLSQAQIRPEWTGAWVDTLDVQGVKLPLVFHLKRDEQGLWQASMDSPAQAAYDMPADEVQVMGDSVALTWKKIYGLFVGKYQEDGRVKGHWIQGMQRFPMLLKRSAEAPKKLLRPQTPLAPFPYDTFDLKIANTKAKVELAGTLSLPKTGKAKTLVILIAGSGPSERDENIFGHLVLKVLSDYLMRQNPSLAVFRYDKRGVGQSTGSYQNATSLDFADDAEAIAKKLRKDKRMKIKNVLLIGHSEGGMIAPVVATKNKFISGLVLLAAPGIPIDKLMREQILAISKQANVSEKELQLIDSINQHIFHKIKTQDLVDPQTTFEEISPWLNQISSTTQGKMGLNPNAFKLRLAGINSAWYRTFIRFNPQDYLRKVNCPVFALNGDKDVQVLAESNLPGIQEALETAKNRNFRCELLPEQNHLFQTCQTCSIEEYGKLEETFAPSTLELIGEWISENFN